MRKRFLTLLLIALPYLFSGFVEYFIYVNDYLTAKDVYKRQMQQCDKMKLANRYLSMKRSGSIRRWH